MLRSRKTLHGVFTRVCFVLKIVFFLFWHDTIAMFTAISSITCIKASNGITDESL